MLSGRHALVMDFGVAKAVRDAGGETLTTVGVAVGTPTYMSPEQATGAENLDQRSDIYALGVMAYEMLTGRPPFSAKTAAGVLSAHVLEKPAPIRTHRPSVPPRLEEIVMRCLEKEPADRWQSAEDLIVPLESLSTPSGGTTPTTTRPVNVVSPAPATASGPDATSDPPASTTSSSRTWLAIAGVLLIAATAFGVWKFMDGAAATPGGIDRVAVLPFRDISGKDAEFAESMQDAVITSIAGLNRVGVVPRSEMAGQTNKRVRDIAEEFGVNAVFEGTLFRAGDIMRINVQLVEPETVRHYWSGSFEIDVRNVLSAQDSVVKQINAQVRAVLDGQNNKDGTR
jgi:serine/threonine-protein kinase